MMLLQLISQAHTPTPGIITGSTTSPITLTVNPTYYMS